MKAFDFSLMKHRPPGHQPETLNADSRDRQTKPLTRGPLPEQNHAANKRVVIVGIGRGRAVATPPGVGQWINSDQLCIDGSNANPFLGWLFLRRRSPWQK